MMKFGKKGGRLMSYFYQTGTQSYKTHDYSGIEMLGHTALNGSTLASY